jgi:hypothetical protein
VTTAFAPTSPPTSNVTWAPIGQIPYADPVNNPYSAFQYLDGYRQLLLQSAHQRPMLRLWDENHQLIGQIAQEVSVEAEEIYCDTGSAQVTIRKDNWLSDQILFNRMPIQDLHLTIDPMPTMRSWRTRWGGKITGVTAKRDSKGLHTIELSAVHNREHLKHILAGANPIFPPELQIPKLWIFPWNCRTALSISLWINLARQFEPLLAIPDNIFNPTSFLGLDLQNINPLAWPIQVQYLNPISDTSRFEVFAARWQDFHTVSGPLLEDAGCQWRAYTFLKGEDDESPHTELVSSINQGGGLGNLLGLSGFAQPGVSASVSNPSISEVGMPTRSCVVLACEQKNGVTGPLGNFTTGFIDAIATTLDDLTTNAIVPQFAENGSLYTEGPQGEGPLVSATPGQIANAFGAAPAPPTVVYQDGEFSGIVESNHMITGTTAKTIMTGGKCVAGDTIIEGPDGDERIDLLAKCGEPFKVWSITPCGQRVSATATEAFKKGTAELFEYVLDDGRSIKAAVGHRFLTDKGYVFSSDVKIGTRFATVDYDSVSQRTFASVVDIQSVGVADFYDMSVPVWENYAAQGIWNHNSPGWVNDLITFGIKYALSQLSDVIEFAYVGGLAVGEGAVQATGTPGLDELYQGELDDTILAYQRFSDPAREIWTGTMGFLEEFQQGTGTAYTISGILSLRAGQWKTRPFTNYKTTVRNAAPFIYGIDFTLGDRVGFQMDNLIYCDMVAAAKYSWNINEPVNYSISIGTDYHLIDPVSKALIAIAGIWNLFGMMAGSGQLF